MPALPRVGGGDFTYERVGVFVENFELNPKRQFLTPERDHI